MSSSARKSKSIVTEQDILKVEAGREYSVPPGALVTPLARQVALERQVSLKESVSTLDALSPDKENKARDEIVRVGALLYQKGFIVANDGNISTRLSPERLLVTPTGKHKGFLSPEELLITDLAGNPIKAPSGLKPTSEMPMHLEVYRQRPDVRAVVHAHLPTAVALSIAGIPLDQPFLPEAILTLGPVPTTEYATPSSDENVRAIRSLIAHYNAILLRRHGALTVGKDPFDAFMRMESVEYKAQVVFMLQLLGTGDPLPREQVAKLLALRQKMGIKLPE